MTNASVDPCGQLSVILPPSGEGSPGANTTRVTLLNLAVLRDVERCTPLAYSSLMFTFIESSAFARACSVYLDDDEYAELQQFMIQNPEAGQPVPGSGGVRKLRWSRPGMGKRGGLRVIYFLAVDPNEFWMLTIYAKAKRDDVPGHILKQLLEVFRNG